MIAYHVLGLTTMKWEMQGFSLERCLIARCSCQACQHTGNVIDACLREKCICCVKAGST